MSNRSVALYDAISADVSDLCGFTPVGLTQIPPDATYREFVSSYLISNVVRKWIPDETGEIDRLSKQLFLTSNKKCRDWRLHLGSSWDELLWGEFLKQVDSFLHPNGMPLIDSWFDVLRLSRTGPGAALGSKGNTLYSKLFESKMACTSVHLYTLYKDYISWFTSWDEAEANRYSRHGEPDIVNGSRSSFVPKTSSISRLICVEPSLNMFFQLGMGAVIEGRLRSLFGIDLASQPTINRQLAYLGSKDGSFSTIDLSSASDSISLRLCGLIFPSWFLSMLGEMRSSTTKFGSDEVRLNMISTMGNGFTFPLQTFIFSCMIRAVYSLRGITPSQGISPNWSCFGDDLICYSSCYRDLSRLLSLAGFTINDSKTFFEGPFRESCGTDWLHGQPVRPVFIKKLKSKQDIFVAINLLNEWSAYTGISLKQAIHYLLSLLHPRFRTQYVPFEDSNDSGIRVPSTLLPRRFHDANLSLVYKSEISIPKKITIGDGTIRVPRGYKELFYNPAGLYCSFLFGELVNFKISTRLGTVSYRTREVCTPRWDYMPTDRLANGVNLSWQQWVTAVSLNCDNP